MAAACTTPQSPVEEPKPVWPPQEEVVLIEDWSAGETAGQAHGWVSGRIEQAARWLDGFLATERGEEEVNYTRLRLRTDTTWEEGGEVDFDFKAQLRLRLPKTSDRLQLLFAGNPDDGTGIEGDPLDDPERELVESERGDSSAGAEYFLLDDLKRNAKLEAGFRFRDGEPTPRVGARYRQSFTFDPLLLRFTQRVRAEEEAGTESRTTLELDRVLAPDLFFRASTELSWFEYREGVYLRQAFLLSDRIAERSTLTWIWSNDFRSEPHGELDFVRLRLAWRHALWKRSAFVELAPEMRFDRERDFEAAYALLLRFDVYFGAEDR